MELYSKFLLVSSSTAAATGVLNLIRSIQAEGLRVKAPLGGRVGDKASNKYIFVLAIYNSSKFSVVVKDIRVAVSNTKLSRKGRRFLKLSRFMPGWGCGVEYIKFDLGRHCPLIIQPNSTAMIEEEMFNSLIVEEKWLLAFLKFEGGKNLFSNDYECGDILDDFEIYTVGNETARQAAKGIIAFGSRIDQYRDWQRNNPDATLFPERARG